MNLAAARKHEGACGAAFDNPELIVAAVVGDGEAETGPLTTSWHVNKFLGPIRDGAVLPVLQGYKINNPTLLSRISRDELDSLFRGYGWTPYFVEGSDPQSLWKALIPKACTKQWQLARNTVSAKSANIGRKHAREELLSGFAGP